MRQKAAKLGARAGRGKPGSSSKARGFTMIELMVSLAVFSIFMVVSATFWSEMVSGGFQEQRRITDLQQTARLAMEYISSELRKAGAGQLFAPRMPNTSPGFAVIPLSVTSEDDYGVAAGPLPFEPGDGGPGASDQITVVYGIEGRVGRVIWDSVPGPAGAGTIKLDFQLRDATQDATVNASLANQTPYPFFTGFFSPAQESPFSPGPYDPTNTIWENAMLLIKTPDGIGPRARSIQGETNQRSHFRLVRVTGIVPQPSVPSNRYQMIVSFNEEPTNPFNRWLQTLRTVNGGQPIYFYDVFPNAFYNSRIAEAAMNIENIDGGGGVMMGCSLRSSPSDPIRNCGTAMLVKMRTFFIAPPGSVVNPEVRAMPALAILAYEVTPRTLAEDAIILTEGVEDLQIEYFIGRGQRNVDIAEQDAQANQGIHDVTVPSGAFKGLWVQAEQVPGLHLLTGVRVSIAAAMDVGKTLYSANPAARTGSFANRLDNSYTDDRWLRRIVRQFIAMRNTDTPYAPPEEEAVIVTN